MGKERGTVKALSQLKCGHKFPLRGVENDKTLHKYKDLGFQRNQPEDREGLSRTRRPGRGHLGHSGEWQDIEGNHTRSTINFPIQQKPQTRGLEGHGSSSSAPPTPQRPFLMEHGKQKVQPSIPLGRTLSKFPEEMSQRDRVQRPYGNHQRLESHQKAQTS
ncbi:hypothetical protein O181_051956 [Austropuccinia psidii MF-1]|uniref:Uncharacterized protein n=1 Tax=Austropuccinia psidii MF-1 TaxID=1389203 RepID=A0A9Q3E4P6_9BASI|nr:hypothetical protein [Austropuccinia psidii MF-1]